MHVRLSIGAIPLPALRFQSESFRLLKTISLSTPVYCLVGGIMTKRESSRKLPELSRFVFQTVVLYRLTGNIHFCNISFRY